MGKPRTAVRDDQRALIRKVFEKTDGIIVELGVDWGLTTEWLRREFPGRTIIGVDLWDDAYHRENIADGKTATAIEKYRRVLGVFENDKCTRIFRVDACKPPMRGGESVSAIFFDASHDYPDVKQEILAWVPWLADGCGIVVHDANRDPVKQSCEEALAGQNFRFERGMCICRYRK